MTRASYSEIPRDITRLADLTDRRNSLHIGHFSEPDRFTDYGR